MIFDRFGLHRPSPGPGTARERSGMENQPWGRGPHPEGSTLRDKHDVGGRGVLLISDLLSMFPWPEDGPRRPKSMKNHKKIGDRRKSAKTLREVEDGDDPAWLGGAPSPASTPARPPPRARRRGPSL